MNNKIFTNGLILPNAGPTSVEAVLVHKNEIIKVGTLNECQATANNDYELVDLQGKCMVPGFIDPHIHPMMLGMCKIWADVSYPGVQSIDDLVNVLKAHGEKLPKGAAIRGYGFDQRKLKELRHPTATDLDRVSTEVPVQIMHTSGHCNVINTSYMRELGIRDNTPDPEGGSMGRDKNGFPTGSLFDSANDFLSGSDVGGVKPGNHGPNIHMPDNTDNLMQRFEVGQQYILAAGITTVNEIQLARPELNTYLSARDQGKLKIRVEMSFLSNYLDEVIELGFNSSFGDDYLTIGSIKYYSDASLLAGTANVSTGYMDSDVHEGYNYHTADELIDLIVKAHKNGLHTATHAQGDLAIEVVLQAVEKAQKEHPRTDVVHRIEHCGLPTEDQVRRMGELRVYPVPQPEMNYLYGDGVVNAVGMEIAQNYSPMAWYKKYGLPLILSSDAPVTDPNPMEAIHAAVSRKTILGTILGSHQAITVEEGMQAYTINAAKVVRRDKQVGSIEEGKLADFAILSQSPYEVSMKEIDLLRDIYVEQTWVDGRLVYQKQ